MKIIESVKGNKSALKEFKDGRLYRNIHYYTKTSQGCTYLYSCGWLIDVVAGHVMHNVQGEGIKAEKFVDITDEFSLVHNSMVKGGV